jgi:hypothetical protein
VSNYIKEYKFENLPKEIIYYDEEPLLLSNELTFYHNKSKFRKELNRLQYLFKNYLKNSLVASGIRDTYLKDEYTNEYLIVLFTDLENVRKTNQIIESNLDKEISLGCFYLKSDTNYMLLLAKDMDGLILGIDTMEEIFTQTFEDYFKQKQFDQHIRICPFKLISCSK